MDRIEELIQEISQLPKGYVSKKTIKGKTYSYWQYQENGKLKSKYIPLDQLPRYEEFLSRRKALERELRKLKEGTRGMIQPSSRAKCYTGYLMAGNRVGAKFSEGVLTYLDQSICPLYIARTGNIEKFLSNRCLDLSRPNARVLLKVLGINDKNESFISLYSYGACISDNYWFKPSGSKKRYEDICFDNDLYSDVALNGGFPQFKSLGSSSPELTNIGSFEKCWKFIDGSWWMRKKGEGDQIFSELFTSKLAENLGIPTAIYEYEDGDIKTKNFADKYNFEPMFALCDDNEDYSFVFETLMGVREDIAQAYVLLLFLDAIAYNVDRHNNNYGLLRDKESGEIVSLAPNFDNNLSLLAYNKTLDQSPKTDPFMKMFVSFLKKSKDAMRLFRQAKVNPIDEEDIHSIFQTIPIKRDGGKISSFILSRYSYLMGLKNER